MIDPTDPAQTARDVIAHVLARFIPNDGPFDRYETLAESVVRLFHAKGLTIVPTPPAGMATVPDYEQILTAIRKFEEASYKYLYGLTDSGGYGAGIHDLAQFIQNAIAAARGDGEEE